MGLTPAGLRVVVTAGAGFIGTHVVERLVRSGAEVLVAARSPGWRPTLPALVRAGKVRFIPASADDGWVELAGALDGVHALVHLDYGPTSATTPEGRRRHELERNVVGAEALVRLLRPEVHVCFVSSAAVYGDTGALPAAEDRDPNPLDAYAWGKAEAEQRLHAEASTSGRRLTVLRPSTVYGPMETVSRAVPNFARRLLAGSPIELDARGLDVRDYVHVRDVARAVARSLESPPRSTRTYNVGSGRGTTTLELARSMARLADRNAEIVLRDDGRAPTSVVCDVRRADDELGHRPEIPLELGLLGELDWFRDNPSQWNEGSGFGRPGA